MTLADDIQTLLQDLKPIYDFCRAAQPEWAELQSIDAAHNEYQAAVTAAEQRWDLSDRHKREAQRLQDKNALLERSDRDRDVPCRSRHSAQTSIPARWQPSGGPWPGAESA